MLVVSMVAWSVAAALLLLSSGLAMLVLVMVSTGVASGPLDIALFTVRQRRTDKRWTGRAFAVSMSFNALGIPIGAALTGFIAARSIEVAIAMCVVTSLTAAVLAAVLIPSTE
jgi:hypothetical protein